MNQASAPATAASADRLAINTLRFLAIDMVEAARSGHPGAPMGQAALAYWLWTRYLRHDPASPDWLNRDRFVLSCGHASALLYGLLHLSGYDLPIEELKNFRQLGSKTPGHPEHGHTAGVETTTGPLGQGFANAVGLAMGERLLAARFNREGFPIFDYRTWVIASDGDLMEGVASEAASLAGHWGLGKLNVFYDANEITIDGSTDLAFSEDVAGRFEGCGWHTERVDDGNDLEAIDSALRSARAETERPSLVLVRTTIGYGSPNRADTAKAHGEPLGEDEARRTREALDWPMEPRFHVPEEARTAFEKAAERGARRTFEWNRLLERYTAEHPEPAAELAARRSGTLPADLWNTLPAFGPEDGPIATRKASGKVLNALAPHLPQLVGGSADLTGSNNTWLADEGVFSLDDPGGRNVHFGVREHAMGSIMNGLSLCRLFIPYGGTFLIFSDYMRPPTRLAALTGLQNIAVFTHDSIFLGEDGPTHQPIGQLAALRAIPNVTVVRPADGNETAAAWRIAIENRTGPTALALTRQGLPIGEELAARGRDGALRGGYVLADPPADAAPRAILIATGSEVSLALAASEALAAEGVPVRVVSLPCWEIFDRQERSYRESVLPPGITARLAIEAASPLGWERYVGLAGDVLAMEGFGASATCADVAEHFGFTVPNVIDRVRVLLGD
ncbi:MAG: transketolase [Acidobacteriota bacterium]